MKKFLNVFIGLILVLLLCVYNVYKSIGDSISSDSIHQNVNNNLFNGFIYDDNGDYKYTHDHLKELNESNTELYINNKKGIL